MEFTIETNVLYEIFKTVKPFTGQDYRHPVIAGICCDVYRDKMRCVALDGNYLFDGVFPILSTKEEGRFVLPIIDGFKRSKDVYSTTRVKVDKTTITIENETNTITVKKFNEDYPDWTKVVPKTPAESHIFMDATLLKNALGAFSKGEKVKIEYRGLTQALVITGEKARTLVLPVRIDPNKEKELYNGMA